MTRRSLCLRSWQIPPALKAADEGREFVVVLPLKPQPNDVEHRDGVWCDVWEEIETGEYGRGWSPEERCRPISLPFAPGDVVVCKETWAHDAESTEALRAKIEDALPDHSYGPYYEADPANKDSGLRWRSPATMPSWASRLTLTIEAVRVARVQDVTEEEARAAGAKLWVESAVHGSLVEDFDESGCVVNAVHWFEQAWTATHGPDAWAANPWVLIATTRPTRANIAAMKAA